MLSHMKIWARRLTRDGHAIYLASRDPRVPWAVKLLALAVAGYALSPIDLIPDFIPVLGYLDDLIIVPAGIYFTLRLIPERVKAQSRLKAEAWMAQERSGPKGYFAAAVIVLIWLAVAYWAWKVLV